MLILALDTAGVDCAACLYDSSTQTVLAEVTEMIGKGHAERLMALIDQVLEISNKALSDVGRIAVVIGPGSFTGIRVGVAAARGFALSLGVEAVGVTTLETVAAAYHEEVDNKPLAVVFDAKRDEAYFQLFNALGEEVSTPELLNIDVIRQRLNGFEGDVIGSGRAVLMSEGASIEKDRFPIAVVAKIASLKADGCAKPKPLYLRSPDAKPQTGFALERKI